MEKRTGREQRCLRTSEHNQWIPPKDALLATLTDQGLKIEAITQVDSLAFVAAGEAGLHIFDLQDPTAPLAIGFYDTPGFAYQVAVHDDLIYVADGLGGISILRFDSKTRTGE